MRREDQCKPRERYLFSDEYFSEKAVSIWQSESVKRCKDKPKGEAYEKYIDWKCTENEIAVFTLYAYADFKIPKKFDVIFQLDNPDNYINIEYELSQSIWEAWCPTDEIADGHKHLCIFKFEKEIPSILYLLHEADENFYTPQKNKTMLGFCDSKDFDSIKNRIAQVLELKKQYGDKWWEYDMEE